MQPLEKLLRNKLEKTIKDARDIAEDSARAALEQLGVGEPTAYPHLTEADRVLRRKLRAHGRQLGNGRNAKGEQALDRLIEEVAYEHWHRMLFARYLAENNLLMYPDPDNPVAVTLEECEDLAADEGASNGWELASRYAARMLPQIFRPDSPVFQLTLPPEHQQKLERLIADLSKEIFTASDSLGWVYQFWQAKKKDEINASEVKIGARELPAVTQLFTEPYMVSFLLDNSLGAWWAARRLSEKALKTATSEEELRRKAAIPGVPLDYLRFVQQDDGSWTPAAGTFDGWPEQLSELKTIDPCCGSGHFFVAAFLMLVPMRMEREGLSARQAVDRVISENIHGLELDQRCVELAAFALALSAWKYPDAGGYRPLPDLNIACSGLDINTRKEEWLSLAGENTNLRLVLEEIYIQFKDATVLGSLINPVANLEKGELFDSKWEDVGPLLTKALAGEKDDKKAEMGVVAKGISDAAKMLSSKFHLIFTNVPYLAKGKQSKLLTSFTAKQYPSSRSDLSTVFLERCSDFCHDGGTYNVVLPQNWFSLTSYTDLRRKVLKRDKWNLFSRLGAKGFQTPMWDFNVVLVTISKGGGSNKNGSNIFAGCDVSDLLDPFLKAQHLKVAELHLMKQSDQIKNPDHRITLEKISDLPLLSICASSYIGLHVGDWEHFRRFFWDSIFPISEDWRTIQNAVSGFKEYDGLEHVIYWPDEGRMHIDSPAARVQGRPAWGNEGVAISMMAQLPCCLYLGGLFRNGVSAMIPNSPEHLKAIWTYCSSKDFSVEIRKIDQKLYVTAGTLVKVPFDVNHWTRVAEEKYPNGLPKPYSDDPIQWIFHGHPCGSVVWNDENKWTVIGHLRTDATVLQVTVARLLGYRWPAELNAAMELSDEANAWVKRSQELLPFADEDGIVSIPPVRGEMRAEDRLENLLAAAYGSEWSSNKKAELLAQAGHAGKTLETWLRDKFFTQHCKLFHHRPFIWHIWDGLHDGFAAMVNYHKLDAKLLETLIYNYLGDWISRQKQDIGNGVDGAQEKLAAAEVLKKKLELILEGEGYPDKKNPEKSYGYDIFVRWKPIEKQPIGWNPDLNDGVRLNIRPFMTVPDVGKKGAGILRDKPNIKWTKDRGKDVASAPWYHLGPIYGGNEGDRINDHHLTLEEKRKAREQIK